MAEKSYTAGIDQQTRENDNFSKVLFTTKRSQLVVMPVPAGKDISEETHKGIDQIYLSLKARVKQCLTAN